jgi:hypothetical protein
MESTQRNFPAQATEPTETAATREAPSALTLGDVQAVLRRAVQIDAGERLPGGSALTVEDLTRIASDAGISPEALQKALRELTLGTLGADHRAHLLDRLFGPRSASAARVAEMDPERARSQLHEILREECLEVVERRGSKTVWEPEHGARASVIRMVRKLWTGRGELAHVQLTSDVRAADSSGARSIVSLDARLDGRAGYTFPTLALGGASAFAALLLAGFGFAELAQHATNAGPLLFSSGCTAVSAGAFTAGVGTLLARAWRARVRRARLSLEHLLDDLTGTDS